MFVTQHLAKSSWTATRAHMTTSVLIGLFCCGFASSVHSAERNISYAGFAYLGEARHMQESFPYSSGLRAKIDRTLFTNIENNRPRHFQLETNYLRPEDGKTSLSFILEQEKISIELVAGVYRLLVQMRVRIVVFDFSSHKSSVVSTHLVEPLTHIEIFDAPPTQDEIADVVHRYIFGGLHNVDKSLTTTMVDTLKSIRLDVQSGPAIGIGAIDITGDVLAKLPSHLQLSSSYTYFLARQLSMALADHQRLSIVPMVDASVREMQYRFTTRDGLIELSKISPSYLIDFFLTDLSHDQYGANDIGTSYVYVAQGYIQLRRALDSSDSTLFSQPMRYPVVKTVLSVPGSIDEWAVFEMSINGLVNQFAKEVRKPGKEWKAMNQLNKADLKQYKNFARVIEGIK